MCMLLVSIAVYAHVEPVNVHALGEHSCVGSCRAS